MKRLRVYLSSTFEDLKEYRAAVFTALEKAGLDVARMEGYTAADERPLDLCLRDVARSEIYVGLYAWRYGYVPPAAHGNPQDKSITELEYRQAESRKLRKLLFFAHPDTKTHWPDRFKDEATGEGERGAKLNAFRNELGTEKTASFFRAPDELATLVLAAIMRSGLSGRPYNVPPRPTQFVPRSNLTQALVESLIGVGGVAGANTLVRGAGGFGKTTLAIDACHQPGVVNAFPDGMLWVALGEKPDLATKLSDLYVSVTGSPPAVAGIDAIGHALAKSLDGHHSLVVVDDAWRVEDLTPFLSLDGPRLLVTTRIRTLIEQAGQSGWLEVPVDEMEAGEAAALLRRGFSFDESTREALWGLADQLGCWPLLINLANARLLEEHKTRGGNLADSIDRVATLFERRGVLGFDRRDSNARNAAVASSVAVGLELAERMYPGLADKAAEISVFPEDVPIPLRALADLWNMNEFDVEEEAVRPLDSLSIVRWDRVADAVRLHDMIRRALEARLAEPAAANRKLIDAWGDPYRLPHDYAWRWFGWHCVHAKELSRLQRLLFDFDWLRAKLEATEINALVGEFAYLPGDPQAELLQGALRLSAHVLATSKSKLAGQLLARLPESQKQLRDQILERALAIREPWLRPLRPSLTPPGGPLLRTLEGHTDGVNAVALTRDGKRAVSASSDHTLKVWDLERGEVLRTLEGHTSSVDAVALTPDGRRAVSASWDRTLKVWDLERGIALRTLEGHTSSVDAVALTPDGQRAVSASSDHTLTVWDLERGEALRTLERQTGLVTAVALTPDGQRAVSASSDHTLKVWDLERGEVLRTLKGHTHWVNAVALTPDGQRAVSASSDHTLKVWDLERGEVLRTLEGHTHSVDAVALTPDGQRAVSASDRTLKVWDLERGEVLCTLERHAHSVEAVALTPDGKRAVSASRDCTLKVWDLERGEALRTLEEHTHSVDAVALTPDGKRAVSASRDCTLKVWDLECGEALRTLEGHSKGVSAVALTWDGQRAVSASADCTLKVWDLERGEMLHALEGHTQIVSAVALTPDGRRAVSASADCTLKVWGLERGDVLHTLEGHTKWVSAVALTPDGQRAVSASSDHTLKVWGLERGDVLHTLGHAHMVTAVALTPDGRRAVSASVDSTLKVWDLERGELLRTLKGHTDGITAVALTPDGQRAVSASADCTLKVWGLERGEALRTLEGHKDTINAVALTRDGQRAVSASADRTVAVWDLEIGELVATFGADSKVQTAAAAPDGRTIVAGDAEGRVHFLRLENVS